MPIPFGKAFSYGTFLQYLRSPGLNALPCRPTVSREHWLRGLFLLTYCTNEPISARIFLPLQLSKDKPCNDALLNHKH